jgi:hypothetical protein
MGAGCESSVKSVSTCATPRESTNASPCALFCSSAIHRGLMSGSHSLVSARSLSRSPTTRRSSTEWSAPRVHGSWIAAVKAPSVPCQEP